MKTEKNPSHREHTPIVAVPKTYVITFPSEAMFLFIFFFHTTMQYLVTKHLPRH